MAQKRQSWTLDEDILKQGLVSAAKTALETIRSLVLIKTGKTRNEGLMLDNKLDVYIDLEVVPYMSYDNPYEKQMQTWDEAVDTFAAEKARNYVAPMLPKKTGNLRENALKVRKTKDDKYEVYIDYLVAPYAQYPNVNKIIKANWPLIEMRFQENLYATISARTGGLYNNRGAVKIIGGGYFDEEGEFIKTSQPGDKSKWEYRRYNP
jgi:hypothetical protein